MVPVLPKNFHMYAQSFLMLNRPARYGSDPAPDPYLGQNLGFGSGSDEFIRILGSGTAKCIIKNVFLRRVI